MLLFWSQTQMAFHFRHSRDSRFVNARTGCYWRLSSGSNSSAQRRSITTQDALCPLFSVSKSTHPMYQALSKRSLMAPKIPCRSQLSTGPSTLMITRMWSVYGMTPCGFVAHQDNPQKCSQNLVFWTLKTYNKFESMLLKCLMLTKNTYIDFPLPSLSSPCHSLVICIDSSDQKPHQTHFEEYLPNHYHAPPTVLSRICSTHELT